VDCMLKWPLENYVHHLQLKVQLASTKRRRMWGKFSFMNPLNSAEMCTDQQSISQIIRYVKGFNPRSKHFPSKYGCNTF
jgi:hypothetical protein